MGKIEQKSQHKAGVKKLQQIVLGTVGAVGLLSVVLLAPNVLSVLKTFGLTPRPRQKEIINLTRARLVKAGYLSYNDRGLLKLTPKGEAKLRQLDLHDFRLKKPKRWDGKWRILIFDISERRKYLREKVRRTLAVIGFIRLQDSVWVYPYPCDDLVTLLKADFSIGRELLYLIVDSIEHDSAIRKHFGLANSY